MMRRIVLLVILLLVASPGGPALAQGAAAPAGSCQFVLGFQTLHDLIPTVVGTCLDDEQHNPANGDALQHTSGGLLVWRKRPQAGTRNWTAFTDGYHTWINGPNGLAERLNTQRYSWEANPDGLPLAGAPSRAGPPSAYPPPSSPGAVDPTVTQANIGTTICVGGYTATVRPPTSYTDPLKVQQLAALGLPGAPSDYEEDHVVPLEVGGAPSDPRNLTPEHDGEPYGAHVKDRVEHYLHGQVRSGKMTLAAAPHAIEADWVAVYLAIGGTSTTTAPAPSPTPAPTVSGVPSDVTAICNDGTYSYSQHRSGTCSYHGGVKQWVNEPSS